ncbi:response regulator transcription factor [Alloalcanivorax profundimaris]
MNLLIVEDNRDIAENIADYLEPKGHQLDFAIDGQQGLELARSTEFDAIVLDLMLPRMSGIELCKQLRAGHNHTPVIMLTARDQLDDKLLGFEVGADDYLVKPFSVKELEARLLALLKRQQNEAPALHVADLSFDTQTLEVRRGNQALELNPIQRKLLHYLMENSPKVVKRAQLEQLIWGITRRTKTYSGLTFTVCATPSTKPLINPCCIPYTVSATAWQTPQANHESQNPEISAYPGHRGNCHGDQHTVRRRFAVDQAATGRGHLRQDRQSAYRHPVGRSRQCRLPGQPTAQ